MNPKLLFDICNWSWIAMSFLSKAANEIEAIRDFEKNIEQLKWLFLGGALFYVILFFCRLQVIDNPPRR